MCSINHNMLQELVTKLNISYEYDISFKHPVNWFVVFIEATL